VADERRRFEEWLATKTTHGDEHVTVQTEDGRYLSPVTSGMWAAWQAASHQPNGAGAEDARDAALRALVERWRKDAVDSEARHHKQTGYNVDWSDKDRATILDYCADELVAAMSDQNKGKV